MKSKPVLLLISIFALTLSSFEKKEKNNPYVLINEDIFGAEGNGPAPELEKIFPFGGFDYAVYEFTNILWANLNNKREMQRIEQSKMQALAKLNIIKNQYLTYEKYPSQIQDGWHMAIATDNINFCNDVKVLVRNNKPLKIVIDNYIPIKFSNMGEIKKGKNVVTMKKFNGEQLSVMELYFVYDIEEQQIVQEPIKPGYVTLWTDTRRPELVRLKIDGQMQPMFTESLNEPPQPFSKGTISKILKPGTYYYEAEHRGSGKWKGELIVKSGYCLIEKVN